MQIVQRIFRKNGDAVVSPFAVKSYVLEPDSANFLMRKLFIDTLRFLQAKHVGLICFTPTQNMIEPCRYRVDVPGRDLHKVSDRKLGNYGRMVARQCEFAGGFVDPASGAPIGKRF